MLTQDMVDAITHVNDIWEQQGPERFKEMWQQARSELLGYANALERANAGITADQIRMAVALADDNHRLKHPYNG